jgi:hypothetical protein
MHVGGRCERVDGRLGRVVGLTGLGGGGVRGFGNTYTTCITLPIPREMRRASEV